jgi:hypothetical protein
MYLTNESLLWNLLLRTLMDTRVNIFEFWQLVPINGRPLRDKTYEDFYIEAVTN